MAASNEAAKAIAARWILPMQGPPVYEACVIVKDNIIEAIIEKAALKKYKKDRQIELIDFGESIIAPGFINLHTHLEHTELAHLSRPTEFTEWLAMLMKSTAGWSFENRARSAQAGVDASIAAGTTTVVDISYSGASVLPLCQSGLRAIIGLEIFGYDEQSAEEQWQQWLAQYQQIVNKPAVKESMAEKLMTITVSPHSPYTVAPAIWDKAQKWSEENKRLVLAHLAESPAERQWFSGENEDLKQFLIFAFSKRQANFAGLYGSKMAWKKTGLSPVKHLESYGLLNDNLLAAHAVQIDSEDIEILKKNDVSIAHCPRSNSQLRCGAMPLSQLLTNEVKVGLGTDSAASSNNLDLRKETRYAAKVHGNIVDGQKLSARLGLELITIRAAQCLGLDEKIGSLAAGKLADINVFSLPKGFSAADNVSDEKLYSALLGEDCELSASFVNGKRIRENVRATKLA